MLFIRKHNTEQTPVQEAIPFRFQWRDGGSIRISTFTGYQDYTGRNMPRGQYLQADGARWVHQSAFVGWVY